MNESKFNVVAASIDINGWKIFGITTIIAVVVLAIVWAIVVVNHNMAVTELNDKLLHYELVIKTERQILGILNEKDTTINIDRRLIYQAWKDSLQKGLL